MFRQVAGITFILAIFSALTACQHNEILGLWETIETQGGIANTLNIKPDGKLRAVLVVRMDRNYRLEGNHIVFQNQNDLNPTDESGKPSTAASKTAAKSKKLTDKKTTVKKNGTKQKKSEQDHRYKFYGEDGEPVVYDYALNNDELKLSHDESKTVLDMRREGQATTPGTIYGHWTFKHTTGQTAHMTFQPNSILHFRMVLPGGGVESEYKIKDDVIILYNAEKKPFQSVSYKVENGMLVLSDGKNIVRYTRIDKLE